MNNDHDDIADLFAELEGTQPPLTTHIPVGPLYDPVLPVPSPVIATELIVPDKISEELETSEPSESLMDLIDVRKYVTEFDQDYDAISTDLVRDRGKLDQTIAILFQKLAEDKADKADKESLVKALETLTNSNGHRVKLLDSKSKLLASIKSTITTLIQNNVGSDASENKQLVDMLSQDEEDFEA